MSCVRWRRLRRRRRMVNKGKIQYDTFSPSYFFSLSALPLPFACSSAHSVVTIFVIIKAFVLQNDESFRPCSTLLCSICRLSASTHTHNYSHLIENERQLIMNDRVFFLGRLLLLCVSCIEWL